MAEPETQQRPPFSQRLLPKLQFFKNVVCSLGLAYGPLAVSPLFTFNAIMISEPTENEILGALSLCIYTIIFIATIKYVIIVLSTNNSNEGGLFSLAALVLDHEEELMHTITSARLKRLCIFLTIFGTAFALGDIAMTPPIAVLAALDGVETYSSSLTSGVVPAACIILILLFSIQRLGISKVRLVFGVVMLLWALCLLSLGSYNVSINSRCFAAFNPAYIVYFFEESGLNILPMLGNVILVVTGIEELHKEVGRFGVGPIRVGWLLFIFPSLILSYLGQGAALLTNPGNYKNPFYLSIPPSLFWPIFILATTATLIASHSYINSAFTIVSQAIALDYFPNIPITYTSKTNKSEIFVPTINLALLIITLVLVIAFKTSFALSAAYGISLCIVLIITTILFSIVVWVHWKWHWTLRLMFITFFLLFYLPIQLAFLIFNTSKFVTGAWIPLLLGLSCAAIMLIWTWGHYQVNNINNADIALSYDDFNTKHLNTPRTKGMGVFLVNNSGGIPRYFKKYAETINSLPEVIIFISVKFFKVPYVSDDRRMTTVFINDNMIRVTARYGFLEKNFALPDVITRVIKKYDLDKHIVVQQQDMTSDDVPIEQRSDGKTWDTWLIDLVDVEEEGNASIYYFLPNDFIRVNRKSWSLRRWMVIIFIFLRNGIKNQTQRLQVCFPQ